MYPAYISKHNSTRDKTNNSFNDSKRRNRRMVLSCSKNLSPLLQGITSKHNDDFYYLDCLHSFRIENKLKPHEKVCKIKDFCGIVMPSEKDNICPRIKSTYVVR